MATKITKTDRFAMLIKLVEDSGVESFNLTKGESTLSVTKDEMVEALKREIGLLARKNTSSGEKKLTAQQKSNVDLKEMIHDFLAVDGKQTISQLMPKLTSSEEITHGRVTALLSQLCKAGMVVREKKGKDTFFSVAEG